MIDEDEEYIISIDEEHPSEIDDYEVSNRYDLKIRENIKDDMRLFEKETGVKAVHNSKLTDRFENWHWTNARVVDTKKLADLEK